MEHEAKRPDVNLVIILASKYDLGSSVTSALDVAAEMVVDEATGAEVDYFYFTSAVALDQNILWLKITVNQMQIMNVVQRIKNLFGDLLKTWDIKIVLFLDFSVELGVLVEVVSEELGDND